MRNNDYKQLNNVLMGHYALRKPLAIYGGFGIGKSGIVESTARKLAEQEEREYINFFKESAEKQKEVELNPEKYFSLIDVRMSEYDISDLKGLMTLNSNEEYLKFKVQRWLGYLTKPNGRGILFVDEFNLAMPSVLSNTYKIVYDRIVNDTIMSDGWFIVMAGNRECLLGDTLINGCNKPIKDLNIDDKVIDSLGEEQEIKEVLKRQYKGDIFSIKPRFLSEITATENHPFLVVNYKNDKYKGKIIGSEEWIISKNLDKNKHMIIVPKLKKNFGNKHNQFLSLKSYDDGVIQNLRKNFGKKGYGLGISLNKDVAWLMGLYVAEGWTSKNEINFGLSVKEQELADRIKKIALKEFGLKTQQAKPRNNAIRITFCSSILANAFNDWFGKYAENKKIPSFIMFNKQSKYVYEFLKGYIVGDGCYYARRNEISCSSTSKTLIQQIQLLLISFNIVGGIKENEGKKIVIRGKESMSNRSYCFKCSHPKLIYKMGYSKKDIRKHKNENYVVQKDRILIPLRYINKQEFEGVVYNLETENHTYLANNFVVHNCDGGFTFSVPKPLRDRMSEVELNPDFENWRDWSISSGINHTIVTYLTNSQSHFYKVDDEDNQKYVTPRGWSRVSDIMNSNLSNDVKRECILATIGEGIGIQYLKYTELQEKMNFDEIIKNPTMIEKEDDMSIIYLLIGILADRYKNDKEKIVDFNKIIEFTQVFDKRGKAEFVTLLWKMCRSYTKESGKFEKDFIKLDSKTAKTYVEYIR